MKAWAKLQAFLARLRCPFCGRISAAAEAAEVREAYLDLPNLVCRIYSPSYILLFLVFKIIRIRIDFMKTMFGGSKFNP